MIPLYKWSCSSLSYTLDILVGGFNPSEKMNSSVGMIIPTIWKIKNVPNHQPDIQ